MSSYRVLVDDNFRYMNEAFPVVHGAFDTSHDAAAICREMVDLFLARAHQPGMTSMALWGQYVAFGDDHLSWQSIQGLYPHCSLRTDCRQPKLMKEFRKIYSPGRGGQQISGELAFATGPWEFLRIREMGELRPVRSEDR